MGRVFFLQIVETPRNLISMQVGDTEINQGLL